MPMTDAQKKADKKYRELNKPLTFAIAYKRQDIQDGQRLKAYLTTTGKKANSYIKSLIKADLDAKGVGYPESGSEQESDQKTTPGIMDSK